MKRQSGKPARLGAGVRRAGLLALLVVSMPAVGASAALPANLGGGLRALLGRYQQDPSHFDAILTQSQYLNYDAQSRVLVEVHPSGRLTLDRLASTLRGFGAEVLTIDPNWRLGVVSAYVPMNRVAAIAAASGVSSVVLVHKPVAQVGKTTSQGAAVIKADLVNQTGITGSGITVGVMSDSYNKNTLARTTAKMDVASGDLPKLVNGSQTSPGVKFLIEGPAGSTDEGRGMAQIVYDVAPGAALCFATAYRTETDFANNIRSLRTSAACNADVIVDDIIYLAEPMFSDGRVAQAVDEVVTSTTMAGKPVVYFSSAGNRGKGYSSSFRVVADATARGTLDAADTSINLASIPASVSTAGGFQDFDPGSAVDISQKLTCTGGACQIVFQWDDPFDLPNGVTTDFNFLVFDAAGNYVSSLSLVDDNFAVNQPLEISDTSLTAETSYTIAIARTGSGTQKSRYLRYVSFGGSMLADYTGDAGSFAATYGHSCAANGNGVAAYVYDDVPTSTPPYDGYSSSLESFSSPGPITIAIAADGTRLATPVTRNKPDLAAPDGVNTTFFPVGALSNTDYEGDGYPNFFGTSAAAPHAAGAAALLLSKNGPRSLTPATVRSKLQQTAPARDIDPLYSAFVSSDGRFRITASGAISTDPNVFRISQASNSAPHVLYVVNIDLAPTGLQFDPTPTETGFPVTVGGSNGPVIINALPDVPVTALSLAFDGFAAGKYLSFGVDRDIAALAAYGNSPDLLAGAAVSATFEDKVYNGVFKNVIGSGYAIWDGYGLIDVQAAAATLP